MWRVLGSGVSVDEAGPALLVQNICRVSGCSGGSSCYFLNILAGQPSLLRVMQRAMMVTMKWGALYQSWSNGLCRTPSRYDWQLNCVKCCCMISRELGWFSLPLKALEASLPITTLAWDSWFHCVMIACNLSIDIFTSWVLELCPNLTWNFLRALNLVWICKTCSADLDVSRYTKSTSVAIWYRIP